MFIKKEWLDEIKNNNDRIEEITVERHDNFEEADKIFVKRGKFNNFNIIVNFSQKNDEFEFFYMAILKEENRLLASEITKKLVAKLIQEERYRLMNVTGSLKFVFPENYEEALDEYEKRFGLISKIKKELKEKRNLFISEFKQPDRNLCFIGHDALAAMNVLQSLDIVKEVFRNYEFDGFVHLTNENWDIKKLEKYFQNYGFKIYIE